MLIKWLLFCGSRSITAYSTAFVFCRITNMETSFFCTKLVSMTFIVRRTCIATGERFALQDQNNYNLEATPTSCPHFIFSCAITAQFISTIFFQSNDFVFRMVDIVSVAECTMHCGYYFERCCFFKIGISRQQLSWAICYSEKQLKILFQRVIIFFSAITYNLNKLQGNY